MKILVAPLNWGLGHATRCIPLIRQWLNDGHEVVLGGDGESLSLLRRTFPTLRYVQFAPLQLRYSKSGRQVFAMLRALPRLWWNSLRDHAILRDILRQEHFDRVVSDNRFGLYSRQTESVYITHQLHIRFPRGWRWAEPLAERLHARIYARFNKVWVPDYADPDACLAGQLSHPDKLRLPASALEYIGALSRFPNPASVTPDSAYATVAVLSGLEPLRTQLEQSLLSRFANTAEPVLIVRGLIHQPPTRIRRGNITLVPYMADSELVPYLLGARHIIARSGYSTIMDLHTLGLLQRAELIPTPGQPEQEYLAEFVKNICTDKKKAVILQAEKKV